MGVWYNTKSMMTNCHSFLCSEKCFGTISVWHFLFVLNTHRPTWTHFMNRDWRLTSSPKSQLKPNLQSINPDDDVFSHHSHCFSTCFPAQEKNMTVTVKEEPYLFLPFRDVRISSRQSVCVGAFSLFCWWMSADSPCACVFADVPNYGCTWSSWRSWCL